MATITDLATVAAATAAGYILTTYTTGGGPTKGGAQETAVQKSHGETIAILEKKVSGASGQSAVYLRGVGSAIAGLGGVPANLTTAKANALSALNANRKARYAGNPAAGNGATVVPFNDGLATVPTVDTT